MIRVVVRGLSAAFAVAVLSACLVTGVAEADYTGTLDFDSFSTGTSITDQYAGITFASPADYGFTAGTPSESSPGVVSPGAFDCPPPIVIAAHPTHSGANAANLGPTGGVCGTEFGPHGTFAVLSSFADDVSVYIGNPSGTGASYELDAYDINRNLLTSATVTGNATGAENRLHVSATTGEIAYIAIEQTSPTVDDSPTSTQIDDLSFTVPTSSQGYVALTLLSAPAEITQGTTGSFTFGVVRFNGASGPVTISLSGVPSGVAPALSENPVTLPDTSSTLTLKVPDLQALGPFTLSASAGAPGDISGPAVTAVVGIVAPFSVFVGNGNTLSSSTTLPVMPCSSASATVRVVTGPLFTGPINLGLQENGDASDIDSATLSRSQLQASDYASPGEADQTFTVSRGERNPSGQLPVEVTASSVGFNDADATIDILRAPSQVGPVSPTSGTLTPQALKPGTSVTITGEGFCPDSTVEFGNADAVVRPYSVTSTTIQVRVPRLATTGPVKVLTGNPPLASPPSTQSVNVNSYRNANGWSFHNYIPSGFDIGELSDLFGVGQVYFSLNPCWPLGSCDIPLFPTPTSGVLLAVADGVLANPTSGGACMGFSLSTQRILESKVNFTDFNAHDNTINSIDSPAGPSSFTRRYIDTQALAQFSQQFAFHYVAAVLDADSKGWSVDKLRGEIEGVLQAGRYPLIALHDKGGGGHVVVAYDVEDVGPHEFYIDVYDPNDPFGWHGVGTNPSDELSADGALHMANVENSRIHVLPDGTWSLPSTGYSGGGDEIIVTDPASIPVQPTMVDSLPGSGLYFGSGGPVGVGSAGATAAPSHTTQLSAGTRTLYAANGHLNTDPATRLNATPFAPAVGARVPRREMYLLGKGAADFTQTVVGTRSGADTYTLLEHGLIAQIDTHASRGVSDQLDLHPSSNQIGFRTSAARAPLTLTLTGGGDGGSWHTASVTTTSFHGAGDGIRLNASHDTLSFAHSGRATTFSFTLSSLQHDGAPGSFASGPIAIGARQTASISSIRWSNLGGSTLKVRIGRRTLTVVNHLKPRRLVRTTMLMAHKTRDDTEKLTVHATLARLPHGATIAIAWLVRHAGHTVARHVVRLASNRRALRRTWTFEPKAIGTYTATARVIVVTPVGATGVTSSVATKTTTLHRS
jgi:hypothetical protein